VATLDLLLPAEHLRLTARTTSINATTDMAAPHRRASPEP